MSLKAGSRSISLILIDNTGQCLGYSTILQLGTLRDIPGHNNTMTWITDEYNEP
jgi:hypothetical protein